MIKYPISSHEKPQGASFTLTLKISATLTSKHTSVKAAAHSITETLQQALLNHDIVYKGTVIIE